MTHLSARNDAIKFVCKEINNHQGLGAAIVEGMFHFRLGIERIDVHKDATGFEDPDGCNGPCQAVWHLHSHSVALRETQFKPEISGKIVGICIDLRIGQ